MELFSMYELIGNKRFDMYFAPNVNYCLERLKSEMSYRGYEVDYSELKEVNGKYEYNYDGESVIVIEQI